MTDNEYQAMTVRNTAVTLGHLVRALESYADALEGPAVLPCHFRLSEVARMVGWNASTGITLGQLIPRFPVPVEYVAGYNRPGYLPDSEPMVFDTLQDAIEGLVSEMETASNVEHMEPVERDRNAYYDEEEDAAAQWAAAIEEARRLSPGSHVIGPDGFAYFVNRHDVPGGGPRG